MSIQALIFRYPFYHEDSCSLIQSVFVSYMIIYESEVVDTVAVPTEKLHLSYCDQKNIMEAGRLLWLIIKI